MDDTSKLYAVIMAGGRGERFWPAGRYSRPKQLLPLLSERSMIEETVQRLFPLIAPDFGANSSGGRLLTLRHVPQTHGFE